MRKTITLAAIALASCGHNTKTISCEVKEVKAIERTHVSTIEQYNDPYYVVVTDCGIAAFTKRKVKVGDTIPIRVTR